MKTIVSVPLSSLALLLAACGGSGTSGANGSELTGDAGAAGADMGGAGGEAGSSAGATPSGGTAGVPGSGGMAGEDVVGGSASNVGGSDSLGGAAGNAGAAGSSGSSGSAADDDGGVAAGGTGGAGGGTSDGGADAPLLVAPPPAGVVAYAYAGNKSQDEPYSPLASYGYNQGGGTITIDRTGVGIYTVEALDLSVPIQNVQATAYDQAAYCYVGNSSPSTAFVVCRDSDGAYVDAAFSFLAFGPGATAAYLTGYAMANQNDVAEYTPDPARSYNAGGGAVTARRAAAGTYSIEFAGLNLTTGNVQITGQGASGHCNVTMWSGDEVQVRCYDDAGALTDARYAVLITQKAPTASSVIVGYAETVDADDPGGDITETPGVDTFNNAGGAVIATRTGTGNYVVRFEGADVTGGHVQVTALGANAFCNVGLFNGDQLSVMCFDASGVAVNTRFMVAAIR